MYELYKCSIKGKVYRLFYRLNENIRIKVRTPVGLSKSASTGPGVGQGTVSGAIMSANNLDQGVTEYFGDTEENFEDDEKNEDEDKDKYKVKYDEITLNSLLFQDDIMHPSETVEAAKDTLDRFEKLLESKLLDANVEKSGFVIVGGRKARQELQMKVDNDPLSFFGAKLRQFQAERYLGCWLSSTVAESVAITVNKRLGPAYQSIYEARTMIQDCRAEAAGGLTLMLEIFEKATIPALLYGLEAFPSIPKKTLEALNKFSNAYLKAVFGLPKNGAV